MPDGGGLAAIEAVLKNYELDAEPRTPVSGFGNDAFLMFPKPRDQSADTCLLVGNAGPRMFMLTLQVPDGSPADAVRPQLLELGRMVMTRLK